MGLPSRPKLPKNDWDIARTAIRCAKFPHLFLRTCSVFDTHGSGECRDVDGAFRWGGAAIANERPVTSERADLTGVRGVEG